MRQDLLEIPVTPEDFKASIENFLAMAHSVNLRATLGGTIQRFVGGYLVQTATRGAAYLGANVGTPADEVAPRCKRGACPWGN